MVEPYHGAGLVHPPASEPPRRSRFRQARPRCVRQFRGRTPLRPHAKSRRVSPGSRAKASTTSAIPSQPSMLVDESHGGRPRCRCTSSSLGRGHDHVRIPRIEFSRRHAAAHRQSMAVPTTREDARSCRVEGYHDRPAAVSAERTPDHGSGVRREADVSNRWVERSRSVGQFTERLRPSTTGEADRKSSSP